MKIKLFFLYLIFLYINIFCINFSELRGVVLDEKNLTPIVSAKVYVENEFTYTDKDGEFYVDSLFSGANLVKIQMNGYKEYKNVVFLHKGHNSFKFVLSNMYGNKSKQISKVKKIKKEKPEQIKKPKLIIDKEDNDEECYWLNGTSDNNTENKKENTSLCEEENVIIKEVSNKKDSDFNAIMGIVKRLDKRALVHGMLMEKNTGNPIKNTPIIFNDKIIFTDEQGTYHFYTDKQNIEIQFNCKGFSEIKKNIKISNSEMNIDLFSERQGGV